MTDQMTDSSQLYRFLPFDWQGVSGISDILLVLINLILLATVIYAYRSLRESQTSRSATVLIWAIEHIEEIKPDIAIVKGLDPNRHPDWTTDQRAAAVRVGVRMQRLGYMALAGLIDREHFRDMWGPTVVDMWDQLAPFTRAIRRANGEPEVLRDGAFSRKEFERLAEEYRPFVNGVRNVRH